jgi:acetolactate synthase-1/2/3 large subunit
MMAGELATAARSNVKIVVVLLTDNDLALIRIKQQKKGNPIYGTPVRGGGGLGTDSLFGVPVQTARTAVEFRTALETAFAQDGPAVVEAIVDSREYDDIVLKADKAKSAK